MLGNNLIKKKKKNVWELSANSIYNWVRAAVYKDRWASQQEKGKTANHVHCSLLHIGYLPE